MKVSAISIPKLKNEYLTDFRTVRFGNEPVDYTVVDCFMGGFDLSVNDSVNVFIVPQTETEYLKHLQDDRYNCYFGYLCVAAERDGDDYIHYELYRSPVTDKSSEKEIKPYSTIYGRTKEKLIVGETYSLCYKRLK